MKARTVKLQELVRTDRWRAEFYVDGDARLVAARRGSKKIGDVVTLSAEAADPAALEVPSFYYVGLENVESVTGDALRIERVDRKAVRSRSKRFRRGDILYGRLRPYLRKALLVEEEYDWGLCSTELLVLRPRKEVVCGMFLRELLVSKQLTEVICRFQSGAALPRISAEDLLSIEVPMPPIQEQRRLATVAAAIRKQRQCLKAGLERLSEESECLLSGLFS